MNRISKILLILTLLIHNFCIAQSNAGELNNTNNNIVTNRSPLNINFGGIEPNYFNFTNPNALPLNFLYPKSFDINISDSPIFGETINYDAQFSCISNDAGKLVCIIYGDTLYDAQGNIVKGWNAFKKSNSGPPIETNSICNSILIPRPHHKNDFYLFQIELGNAQSNHYQTMRSYTIRYSNGNIAVVDSAKNLTPISFGDLKATLHSNGNDYWLCVLNYANYSLNNFLIDSNGLQTNSHIEFKYDSYFQKDRHYYSNLSKTKIRFAPDGSSIALLIPWHTYDSLSYHSAISTKSILVLYFDNSTAQFSNGRKIDLNWLPAPNNRYCAAMGPAISYSPNSKFLYVSVLKAADKYIEDICNINDSVNGLYQLEISKLQPVNDILTFPHYFFMDLINVKEPKYTRDDYNVVCHYSDLMLTPNHQILMSSKSFGDRHFLIQNPNDYLENLRIIEKKFNTINNNIAYENLLPNIVNYPYSAKIKFNDICMGDSANLSVENGYDGKTYWDFGDGTTDSTLSNHIKHRYQNAGTYLVSCKFSTTSGLESASTSIKIRALPVLIMPNDTLLFTPDSLLITQLNTPSNQYIWNNKKTGYFTYFNIPNKYILTVQDSFCTNTDSFTLEKVSLHLPDLTWCKNDTGRFAIQSNADSIYFKNDKIWLFDSIKIYNQNSLELRLYKNALFVDTVLTTHIKPLPVFGLGNDTLVCQAQNYSIGIHIPLDSFKWTDGFNSKTRVIKNTNTYATTAFLNQCRFSDTVKITALNCLPTSHIDCLDSMATFIFDPQLNQLHLNVNGNFDTLVNGNSIAFKFLESGKQELNWTLIKDSFFVKYNSEIIIKPCQCAIFVPNAFSPNADGTNDIFQVLSNCQLPKLSMEIYSAWGERLYVNQEGIAWDGAYKNRIVQEGNYLYIIRFIDPIGNFSRVLQGRVYLLK